MISHLTIKQAHQVLGVRWQEMKRLEQEDGLPVTRIPGNKRSQPKIHPRNLWRWLRDRTDGNYMSYDEFLEDLTKTITK